MNRTIPESAERCAACARIWRSAVQELDVIHSNVAQHAETSDRGDAHLEGSGHSTDVDDGLVPPVPVVALGVPQEGPAVAFLLVHGEGAHR